MKYIAFLIIPFLLLLVAVQTIRVRTLEKQLAQPIKKEIISDFSDQLLCNEKNFCYEIKPQSNASPALLCFKTSCFRRVDAEIK